MDQATAEAEELPDNLGSLPHLFSGLAHRQNAAVPRGVLGADALIVLDEALDSKATSTAADRLAGGRIEAEPVILPGPAAEVEHFVERSRDTIR